MQGQPYPGGKVPPAPESLRRGCQGRPDSGHRADPRGYACDERKAHEHPENR